MLIETRKGTLEFLPLSEREIADIRAEPVPNSTMFVKGIVYGSAYKANRALDVNQFHRVFRALTRGQCKRLAKLFKRHLQQGAK